MRPSTPSRRWALKLTLVLLAGAVVTWAVAWGCALRGLTPRMEALTEFRPEKWLPGASPDWPPPGAAWIGRTPTHTLIMISAGLDGGKAIIQVQVDHGWPARSMRAVQTGQSAKNISAATLRLRPSDGNYAMPAHVIPVGFALNTILAAGVVLGAFEGVGYALRRKRGAGSQ